MAVGNGGLKKKIRDLERLTRREGIPATKKQEAERAIESYRQDLDKAASDKRVNRRAQKYKLVKFVERTKALRALKKADSGDDQLAYYYYVATFPTNYKYRALFADANVTEETHPYLKDVRARMASGELATGSDAIKNILEAQNVKKSS